ncbi:ABC transporter ATP-binding protein [Saccharibacillus kuerlensis]|uniref:Multidrug resistance ABC transporter ATP-binding/permease protein BmrA n=1 Tax=Saccharibacillus kuerlensis TaxID=459527 RepID=A0ABQ2L2J4_9BACL|nr:ABC transporter ATP-binding protein [Saccharibacillus kuerlensis]GGO00495.1 multidrug resistance ABC transporter ATP-binding/permease protein BmrA [Saccharibacillus kuerlensis]
MSRSGEAQENAVSTSGKTAPVKPKSALPERTDTDLLRKEGNGKKGEADSEGTTGEGVNGASSPGWGTFWRLIARYRPKGWLIAAAVILGLFETLVTLAIPLLTSRMVDGFSAANLTGRTVALLAAAFLGQALMAGFAMYTMSYVGQFIVSGLRRDLWKRVLKLPVSFFDRNTSGETMSRVTNDTNIVRDFITGQVISFLSGIVSIVGAVIILLTIDWKMTLFALLAIPGAMLLLWPVGRRMYAISRDMQKETAEFQGDLGRVLADIRLVKALLAEPAEMEQGEKRITGLLRFGLREARIQSIVSPLMMTIMLLILVALIGYGGAQVARGALTAGALVAIILYMFQIVVPFTQLATFFTQFQKALGATERIQEIMELTPEERELAETDERIGGKAAVLPHKQDAGPSVKYDEKAALRNSELAKHESGDEALSEARAEEVLAGVLERSTAQLPLTFDKVSFGYSADKPILQDLSFTAEAGQTTAFVGPSGAGKTTIFSLIERFYEPIEGRLLYGEEHVSGIPLRQWRGRIAYVSQESPVMVGTIRENLIYGLSGTDDADDAAVEEAVRLANLTEFIASLPQGLETQAGERGVKLSGGQRQRLAIARAILRDPDILLLDEATAHLDSASEALVQQALDTLMRSRTTLVIAHRLSTVRGADKLVVIEKGQATGEGTHAELLSSHAFYRKLVYGQFEPAEVNKEEEQR